MRTEIGDPRAEVSEIRKALVVQPRWILAVFAGVLYPVIQRVMESLLR